MSIFLRTRVRIPLPKSLLQARNSSHISRTSQLTRPSRRFTVLTLGACLAAPLYLLSKDNIHADDESDRKTKLQELSSSESLSSLIRSYAVYSMCSIPVLVDYSPAILSLLSSIPGVKQITEAFIRVTFFEQFVGGDTAIDVLPLLRQLRASNKGALFAYSVEVDENEATGKIGVHSAVNPSPYKRIVNEMIRCIDVAADFEDQCSAGTHLLLDESPPQRRTWVAVKISALTPDAHALHHLSKHIVATRPPSSPPVPFPGCPHPTDLDVIYDLNSTALSSEEKASLRELHADLVRICQRAQERRVKIIIDAEYTWYQPALDALTLSLSQKFNSLTDTQTHVQPLIYATYQAYLRRTPALVQQALAHAQSNNYSLGIKLVRGAYHVNEAVTFNHALANPQSQTLSLSPDSVPPVWTSKADTDACYDKCASALVDAIAHDVQHNPVAPGIGILFGTHNKKSCELILERLSDNGLGEIVGTNANDGEARVKLEDNVTERITFGQLYGMADGLTDWLTGKVVTSSPFVIKYVPYGALSEVMPYLSRRAVENKSVLGAGGAASEKRRAGAAIWRKITG